ncbi:unnamed protein product, partial [Timema podura]|nr:unnamed protein product [Timema podura]
NISNLCLSLSEYISTLDPSELDGPKSEDMDLTTDSARGTSRFKIPTDTLKKGILSVRELLMTKEGGKQGVSREKGMTNKKVPNKVYLSDIPKTVVKQLTEMLKERPPPKVVAKIVEELFHSRSAEGYSPLHFAILMNLKDSLKVMLSVLGKGRHTDIINARDNNKEFAPCLVNTEMEQINKAHLGEHLGRKVAPFLYLRRSRFAPTALHMSVKQNDQNFVSMLLHVGAEVNIPNKAGDTPFHLAVSLGHTQCLEELLESTNYQLGQPQPKLSKKNENGETALHIAAHRMNLEAVNLLCRAGADVNETTLHQGDTVLHIAVNEECMPIIKYIVEKMRRDKHGKLSPHLLQTFGKTDLNKTMMDDAEEFLVGILSSNLTSGNNLRTKIKIDHPNLAGNTALHMSCVVGGKGSVEICRFLMDNKANPYKANYIIERQRMKEQEGTKLKGTSALVEVKQEPDSEPEDEKTPMALMLSEGASSTVNRELCMSTEENNGGMEDSEEDSEEDEDSEADDELVDFHGQTSFDLASNNEDILKLLRKLDKRMEEVEAPTLVVKEEKEEETTTEEEDPNVKLTDETLERLSEILNKSGGWKKLAEMLDYAFLVRNINNASNPSKMLFTYAEQVHGNLSVWNLRGYLDINGGERGCGGDRQHAGPTLCFDI